MGFCRINLFFVLSSWCTINEIAVMNIMNLIFIFYVQEYAWIKPGMIFPFVDYVDRCLVVVSFILSFNFYHCLCL